MTIDNLALRIVDFIISDLENMDACLKISENVRYTWADEIVRQFELYYSDTIEDEKCENEDNDEENETLVEYKIEEMDEIETDL